MQEFVLYSRTGRTDGNFKSLIEAGRLDIVYQCALTALFTSQAHRHDVIFHAILGGAPNPPIHLAISGGELKDARIDERSWEEIFRKVLGGGNHQGVVMDKKPLQKIVEEKYALGYKSSRLAMKGMRSTRRTCRKTTCSSSATT